MARVRKIEKLSKNEQESLITDLVYALVQAKNADQAALFLQDLLTRSELSLLAKRLRIAKLLLAGSSYEEIVSKINVSHGTIAKIAAWLTDRGEGFRLTISKLPQEAKANNSEDINEWNQIKRKYPMYFWPELLLEEIVRSASRRQKERIGRVLDRLDEKSKLNKDLNRLLKVSTT
jgi:uncharacterized protein YerC